MVHNRVGSEISFIQWFDSCNYRNIENVIAVQLMFSGILNEMHTHVVTCKSKIDISITSICYLKMKLIITDSVELMYAYIFTIRFN